MAWPSATCPANSSYIPLTSLPRSVSFLSASFSIRPLNFFSDLVFAINEVLEIFLRFLNCSKSCEFVVVIWSSSRVWSFVPILDCSPHRLGLDCVGLVGFIEHTLEGGFAAEFRVRAFA